MLDNLRESASQSPFFQDELPQPDKQPEPQNRPPSQPFLGMTPVQRFIIALMLFLMTCLVGSFFLLVTEKVVLPFL